MARFPASSALLAAVAAVAPLGAQRLTPTVSAGVAVPTGDYGRLRGPGPLVRAGALVGGPARRVRLRADLEAAWLRDPGGGAAFGTLDGTARVVSALVSVLAGPRGGRVAPYAVAGAGLQWLRIDGAENPYGTVPGARAGLGVRARLGRTEWRAEVTPHLVASDHGTGRDFGVGSYWPVAVGVAF